MTSATAEPLARDTLMNANSDPAAPGSDAMRPEPTSSANAMVAGQAIGEIIRRAKNLSAQQIEQILIYQRNRGVRFGDAAVALKLVSHEDVLWALSQQFSYPYAGESAAKFNRELVVAANPFSEEAETFRDLRSQLITARTATEDSNSVLAVTSPNTGDGKSFFAANIAVAFSQLGGRTLLIDADMRTPRQHLIFGIETSVGLSSILSGRAEANLIRQIHDLPSLYLLPVGTVPPNPLELIQGPAFSLLIHELSGKFDHIVVDTPAAFHGADARVIAQKCGTALVIGRRGKTQMGSMKALLASMRRSRTQVTGVVMNEH